MGTRSTQRVTLPIMGLGCLGSGALIVERALLHTPGVTRAYVNPATEMAYVEYDQKQCSVAALCEVIARVGFDVEAPLAP